MISVHKNKLSLWLSSCMPLEAGFPPACLLRGLIIFPSPRLNISISVFLHFPTNSVPWLPCAVLLEVFITSHLDSRNHFLSSCPKHSLHTHTTVSLISLKCSFVNLDSFPLSMPKLCINMGHEWITGVLVYPFPKPSGQQAGLETAEPKQPDP